MEGQHGAPIQGGRLARRGFADETNEWVARHCERYKTNRYKVRGNVRGCDITRCNARSTMLMEGPADEFRIALSIRYRWLSKPQVSKESYDGHLPPMLPLCSALSCQRKIILIILQVSMRSLGNVPIPNRDRRRPPRKRLHPGCRKCYPSIELRPIYTLYPASAIRY